MRKQQLANPELTISAMRLQPIVPPARELAEQFALQNPTITSSEQSNTDFFMKYDPFKYDPRFRRRKFDSEEPQEQINVIESISVQGARGQTHRE